MLKTAMSLGLLARNVAVTARVCVPTAVEGMLGRGKDLALYDQRLDWWSRRLLEIANVELNVAGREHSSNRESYVVMSNHQSHYDIPVLFQALKRRLRMVAKTELFDVPVFAAAMRVSGFVEIDRQDRRQAVAALRGARAALAEGTDIWIAPEGTRSESGELGPFKKGGFHLALDAGARILPVSIDGTRHVLRAHDWHVHSGRSVRVVISPPIDANAYGKARKSELMAVVREAIAQHLPGED